MLITCGPTQLYPGIDWKVIVCSNGLRTVGVSGEYVQRCGKPFALRLAFAAARAYGFVFDEYGNLTNWYDVPHLWSAGSWRQ